MNKIFLSAILMLFILAASSQSPKKIIKKLGDNPVFFIDSINVDNTELSKYNPTDIAQVTVYKPEEGKALLGEDGRDGIVYIFTKKFAKAKYWQYFQTKSEDYRRLVTSAENDSAVQYILNKRVLKENFEGDLLMINDKIFKEIRFLNKQTLEKEFNIFDKEYGFQIISDIPDDLYKGKKKF